MILSIQKQKRQMEILSTIRTLQFATQRHLMCAHDMGGVRNAHRILKEMRHYTNVAYVLEIEADDGDIDGEEVAARYGDMLDDLYGLQ